MHLNLNQRRLLVFGQRKYVSFDTFAMKTIFVFEKLLNDRVEMEEKKFKQIVY